MSVARGMPTRVLCAPIALIVAFGGCERPATDARAAAGPRDRVTDSLPVANVAARPAADGTGLLPTTVSEGCTDLHAVFSTVARMKGLAPAVAAPRDTTMTFGGLEDGPAEGACYVRWTSTANSVAPNDFLAAAESRGWKERAHLLSADGPDGTVLAISRGGVACVFDMSWDGGDDSDSTYVPTPGFTATMSCFTDRPDRY